MPKKPSDMLQTHLHAEERKMLHTALEGNGWVMLRAAKHLGMAFSSFQRALARHPDLAEELETKGRRPGRPPWKKKMHEEQKKG
jgi:hypothetical protein